MTRPGRLDGKTCLIVGGTGGIGLATARRFLDEGARLVLSGLADEDAGPALDLLGHSDRVDALVANVSDPSAVDSLFERTIPLLGGRLDILIHVAGISGRAFGDGPLDQCSDAGWDAVMDVNAKGTFLTNRAAVRQMLTQPLDAAGLRGAVVNTGSVVDVAPSPRLFGTLAYATSKGAVRALTISAAACYAPSRIRFNMVAPALIDTPMARRAVSDPTIVRYLESKQPLAGGPGSAVDCAEAALYLCEPASRFVTGAVVTVDGGWSLSDGQYPRENLS